MRVRLLSFYVYSLQITSQRFTLVSEMGRKRMLGLPGGPAKQKYKCKVCDLHPRGCDLQRHYKLNTNWGRLEELLENVRILSNFLV